MEPAPQPLSLDQALLAQRGFLRRLARGLLGDEGLAEDVVQEAELRALEHVPRRGENLGAWLVTVTRRLALNARRARVRRAHHEQVAARSEASAGDDEALAGLDLQRAVLEEVRALDEPYRAVVWQRYYEDRTPSEIAARLGLPLATVKTRLRRALHTLRARLDAEHDGDRGSWAIALAPLARVPFQPLAAGSATMALLGIVMKKLSVAVALLLLAWLGWRTWSGPKSVSDLERAPALAAEVLPAPLDVEPPAPLAALALRELSEQAAALSEPERSRALATLVVRARWEGDDSSAGGVGITLWPEDEPVPELRARIVETDVHGQARFEDVAPGLYRVHSDRDSKPDREHTAIELAAGEERALELVLALGLDVVGRVIDGAGGPVAGAEVWLEGRWLTGLRGGRIVARTGSDGGFRLRGLDENQALSAFAPGFAPASLERLSLKALAPGERELRVTLVLDRAGHALHGRVLDPDGAPVSAALVALGTRGNHASGDVYRPRARTLVTDEDGRFHAGWIEPAESVGVPCILVHVLAPGFALARVARSEPGEELLVGLEHGAMITGVVRDAGGQPVADAAVVVARAGEVELEESPFSLPSTRTDGGGGYRIEHVPPGEVELGAFSADSRRGTNETRVVVDGEQTRWDLALGAARVIIGRVVDEEGVGQAQRHVMVSDGSGISALTSDAEGGFVFTPGSSGEAWDFALMGTSGVLDRQDGVALGAEVVLVARAQHASIRGGFGDRAELARAGDRVVASLSGEAAVQVTFEAELDAHGAFAFEQVVPGRYQVAIQSGEDALVRSPWFDVAENETVELDWLETRSPGSLALECALPNGVELSSVRAWLREPGGSSVLGLEPSDGRLRAASLQPGRYRLEAGGEGLALHQEELEVRAGEELRLALTLQAGVSRRLIFVPPAGVRVARLRVVLRERETERELVREDRNAFWGQPPAVSFRLAPGSYTFAATTDAGLTASGALDVLDLASAEAELTFDLR